MKIKSIIVIALSNCKLYAFYFLQIFLTKNGLLFFYLAGNFSQASAMLLHSVKKSHLEDFQKKTGQFFLLSDVVEVGLCEPRHVDPPAPEHVHVSLLLQEGRLGLGQTSEGEHADLWVYFKKLGNSSYCNSCLLAWSVRGFAPGWRR